MLAGFTNHYTSFFFSRLLILASSSLNTLKRSETIPKQMQIFKNKRDTKQTPHKQKTINLHMNTTNNATKQTSLHQLQIIPSLNHQVGCRFHVSMFVLFNLKLLNIFSSNFLLQNG